MACSQVVVEWLTWGSQLCTPFPAEGNLTLLSDWFLCWGLEARGGCVAFHLTDWDKESHGQKLHVYSRAGWPVSSLISAPPTSALQCGVAAHSAIPAFHVSAEGLNSNIHAWSVSVLIHWAIYPARPVWLLNHVWSLKHVISQIYADCSVTCGCLTKVTPETGWLPAATTWHSRA